MRRALASVVAAMAMVAAGTLPAAGQTEAIEAKRAEARRIAAALEAQGRQLSSLAEDYNEARMAADKLTSALVTARERTERTEQQLRAKRGQLREFAVAAYMKGGNATTLSLLVPSSIEELAVRRHYVRTVAGDQKTIIDGLHTAAEDAATERDSLAAKQSEANVAVAAADQRRDEAAAAEARIRSTLVAVEGELGNLVAAEAARRREEEARRAREAEAARRRAAEAAEARRAAEAGKAGKGTGTPAGKPAPPPSKAAGIAVEEARKQLGKPYEWGADGPESFDCSGLTQWAWRAAGRSLPHSSRAQFTATARVALTDVAPGDLVFYGNPIHHVGIVVGNGQMIEASQTGTPVRYASIYRSDFAGAGRLA